MYFGTPCYGYALNCLFVYLVIQRTCPLFKRKQKLFILYATSKNEIHICSNKHETGLVEKRTVLRIVKWVPPVQGKTPIVQVKEHCVNLDMVSCTPL